jgi:hypothetical protein
MVRDGELGVDPVYLVPSIVTSSLPLFHVTWLVSGPLTVHDIVTFSPIFLVTFGPVVTVSEPETLKIKNLFCIC